MKHLTKITIFALSIAILLPWNFSTVEVSANNAIRNKASTDIKQTTITYDDDGGYFVETLECVSDSSSSLFANTNNTTATKTYTKTAYHYNANKVLCWKYSLTATFDIKMGINVTYKNSKASYEEYDSWSLASESHSGSGTKATGTIKMIKNGKTVSKTITIHCDRYGNFS